MAKSLDVKLGAAPVTAVLVVLDLVVGLHAEPVGDGAKRSVGRAQHTGSGAEPSQA